MRIILKTLLAPAWLLLAVLKLAFKPIADAVAYVLAIGGWLLLAYNLFLLIIGNGLKELMLQQLIIDVLLVAVPLLGGLMIGLLQAAQGPIKEFNK